MKVTRRAKKERTKKNPEAGQEVEVDAFTDEGMVVVTIGDSEIVLEPQQARDLGDLILDSADEADSETVEEADDDEEDEDED